MTWKLREEIIGTFGLKFPLMGIRSIKRKERRGGLVISTLLDPPHCTIYFIFFLFYFYVSLTCHFGISLLVFRHILLTMYATLGCGHIQGEFTCLACIYKMYFPSIIEWKYMFFCREKCLYSYPNRHYYLVEYWSILCFSLEHIKQFNTYFMKVLILVKEFPNSLWIQHWIILYKNIKERHSIF